MPGRAAVKRPDQPTAVVVAPDEVGRRAPVTRPHATRIGVLPSSESGRVQMAMAPFISPTRVVDGAGELRGRLAWTTVRLG